MPTLGLRIPVQVSAEGNVDAQPPISDEEAAAIAAREANNAFTPRSIAPPSPDYAEGEHRMAGTLVPVPELPPSPEYGNRERPTVRFDRDYDSDHREDDSPPGYSSLNRRTQSLAV